MNRQHHAIAMEIVSSAGIEVFLDSVAIARGHIWDSTVGAGYWLGTILEGEVAVEQDAFGRNHWKNGSAAAFHSADSLATRHIALKDGTLSAVFVRIPTESFSDILGDEGQALLNRPGGSRFGPCPTVMNALAWQMHACSLRGAARRCFLTAKALECVAHALQESTDACPLRSLARGVETWSSRDLERFYEARAILHAEIANPPPITELARRVGVNARKLSAGFRDLFGQPVYAYIKGRRLDEAKRMLETGEQSIGFVARAFGYQQRHFATEFRRRFGVPPTALRSTRSKSLARARDPEQTSPDPEHL
jgi:AraC family transcriptional activator of pyochelin receptor